MFKFTPITHDFGRPRSRGFLRLVALNHERADEEKRGLIRYLRPEFQNPTGTTQQTLATTTGEEEEPAATPAKPAKIKKQPWPKSLSEQASAVQAALTGHAAPADETDLAKYFTRANKERIAELLETLASLGRARELGDGRYVGVYPPRGGEGCHRGLLAELLCKLK